MTEAEARNWPRLYGIVEAKVKPERLSKSAEIASWPWWQYWRTRAALTEAIREKTSTLVCVHHTKELAFARVSSVQVFSHALVIIALHSDAGFAVLQSRIHEYWARFFGSSLGDTLRYTPSDCFETFPFPLKVLEAARGEATPYAMTSLLRLEDIGKRYYEFRAALMIANNEGLTTTYNRFHDPEERDEGILRLRELHAEMDRAVLDAYGWSDLQPRCEFLLDYEEEGADEEETGKRRKKKPWRYRWPDEVRDEVLARLIALNGERAAEERRLGDELAKVSAADKPKRAARKKKSESGDDGQGGLFG